MKSSVRTEGLKLGFVVTTGKFFLSHRQELALWLQAQGASVTVICNTDPDSTRRIQALGMQVIAVPFHRTGVNVFREAMTILTLARVLRHRRFSLLHGFALKPLLYTSLVAGRVPVVGTVTGMGYVFTACDLKARLLRPLLRTMLAWFVSRPHRRLIVQNSEDQKDISGLAARRNAHRILCLGGGVDIQAFRDRKSLIQPTKRTLVIVCLARLLRSKGVMELARAAHILHARKVAAVVQIWGERDENPQALREDEIAQAQTLGLCFKGRCGDPLEVLAQADIAVLASYREGMPRFLLEAGGMGLPLVSTNVRGCRCVCVEGVSGLTVPPGDDEALAWALERLCTDDGLRRRLGQGAKALVEEHFSIQSIGGEHVQIYETLAASQDFGRQSGSGLMSCISSMM